MRRLFAVMPLLLVAIACDRDEPMQGPAPAEPTEPLRPVEARGPIDDSLRVVDWSIQAKLDADAHVVHASGRLRWTNRGPEPVASIPFHLYLSGMRAEDTAWMRDALRSRRTASLDPDHAWGYIDVTSIAQKVHDDGTTKSIGLTYTERDDPTIMDVALVAPLPPGATVDLDLAWQAQLPRVYARTGFFRDFHMVGQWLPTPVVLDEQGEWHARPWTFYSEFFADFGSWEVELDVPASFVVGATGIRTESWVDADRRHERYRADMVHNFAWVAAPDLLERVDEHDGIRIRQLYPPDRRARVPERHLAAQIAALDSMQARFGPYPWSTITIVHPPRGAEGAAGMEYPTLFTTATEEPLPKWLRALRFDDRYGNAFVTVHEFGHQYFQGLLASDEGAQPWLDEGMNTLSNVLVYLDWYADEREPWVIRIAGQPFYLLDGLRVQLRRAQDLVPIDTPAADFSADVEVYGATVYAKTAAAMLTLRELVGHEAFDRVLADYAATWRFRHPTGDDLKDAFVTTLGERVPISAPGPDGAVIELPLREYFDDVLGRAESIDLAVYEAGNRRQLGTAGYHRDGAGTLVAGDRMDPAAVERLSDDAVEAFAVIHRSGGLQIPVEIEAEFADGTIERVMWDGRARHKSLQWPGRRLVRVTVDPDSVLYLDTRRWNNTAYAAGQPRAFAVERTAGDLGEAIALAILGGVGP